MKELEVIFEEVEALLAANLYYGGLVIALTIPDICAALESEDGRTSGKKFKDWYNRHLTPVYPNVSADDFYSLRCGVVHQGKMGLAGAQYDRIVFTMRNSTGNIYDGNIINKSLQLDLLKFCNSVVCAARGWARANSSNANVRKNLPNIVAFHPNGVAPYLIGVPVIA